MKHFADLTESEKTKFADTLQNDLDEFFTKLRSEHQLCDTCLHSAVIMMCEHYLSALEEMPSNAQH